MPRAKALLSYLAAVVSAILLTSCAGNTSIDGLNGGAQGPSLRSLVGDTGFDFPPPSELRVVAYAEDDLAKLGREHSLLGPNAEDQDDNLLLTPAWPAELAWAVYTFTLEDFDIAETVSLDWAQQGEAGGAWIGVPNWERDAWEWVTPEGRTIEFDFDTALNQDSELWVAVVAADAGTWELEQLTIGDIVPDGWLHTWGYIDYDGVVALDADAEGNLYSCGSTWELGEGDSDGILMKVNPEGVLQWAMTYGTAGRDELLDVQVWGEHVYTCGTVREDGGDYSNILVQRWSKDGELQVCKVIGGELTDRAEVIFVDEGRVFVGGYTENVDDVMRWDQDALVVELGMDLDTVVEATRYGDEDHWESVACLLAPPDLAAQGGLFVATNESTDSTEQYGRARIIVVDGSKGTVSSLGIGFDTTLGGITGGCHVSTYVNSSGLMITGFLQFSGEPAQSFASEIDTLAPDPPSQVKVTVGFHPDRLFGMSDYEVHGVGIASAPDDDTFNIVLEIRELVAMHDHFNIIVPLDLPHLIAEEPKTAGPGLVVGCGDPLLSLTDILLHAGGAISLAGMGSNAYQRWCTSHVTVTEPPCEWSSQDVQATTCAAAVADHDGVATENSSSLLCDSGCGFADILLGRCGISIWFK